MAAATWRLELPSLSADAAIALSSWRPAGSNARRDFVWGTISSIESLAALMRCRIDGEGPLLRSEAGNWMVWQCSEDFEGACCNGKLEKGVVGSDWVPWAKPDCCATLDRMCGWSSIIVVFRVASMAWPWLGHSGSGTSNTSLGTTGEVASAALVRE